MKKHRIGFLLPLVSATVALVLAGCRAERPTPSPPPPPTAMPTTTITLERVAVEPTLAGTPSATLEASPTSCSPPVDWVVYIVEPGDSLSNIALRYDMKAEELQQANCLPSADELQPGQPIYVPYPLPSPTPCILPAAWFVYTVEPGDTLYQIALRYDMKAEELQQANCLPSDLIQVGQRLHVPYYIEPSPTPCIPRVDWTLYTVKSGESLYRIALRYRITVEELQQANCLPSELIQAGQRLYVPYFIPPSALPVVAAISTVIPTPAPPITTPTPSPGLEEFDTCTTWDTYNTEWASAGCVSGQFWITVTAANAWAVTTPEKHYGNVGVTTQAYLKTDSPGSGYGLLCRYQDDQNYYAFLVSFNGRYAILKMENARVTYLINWTQPEEEIVLTEPGDPNIVRATCDGTELTLSVNWEELATATDTTFANGDVGLIVGSLDETQAQVTFEYFHDELLQ
jgi:LysM repeat protein